MRTVYRTFDEISKTMQELEDFLKKSGVSSKNSTMIMLMYEEILLCWRERFPDAQYRIKLRNGFLRSSSVRLEIKGEQHDVFSDDSITLKNLHKKLSEHIMQSYKNGCNVIECVPQSFNSFTQNFRITWKYLRGYRKKLLLCVFVQVFSLALQIAMPLAAAQLIVYYYDNAFTQIVLMSIIYFVMEFLYDSAYNYFILSYEKIYKDMLSQIEVILAENLMKTKISAFEEAGSGIFIQRMTSDIQMLTNVFIDTMFKLGTSVTILGKMISLLFLYPPAFLFFILELIPQSILENKRITLLNEHDTVFRSSNDIFSGMVGEMIHGAKDIRLLRSEESFINKLKTVYEDCNESSFNMKSTVQKFNYRRRLSNDFTKMLFIVCFGYVAFKGFISPAVAVILYNYRGELSNIPWYFGDFLSSVKSFNLTSGRLFSLTEGNDYPKEKFGTTKKHITEGKIEMRDVTFSYTGRPVLQNLNLTVNRNESVAIVGKSGCGKSTLLNILTKLYDPKKGTILIDGTDISELDVDSLRSSMTIVSQMPYLFNMSVRDNLRLVKPDADDDELFEVCRRANIHDDIMNMKDGYDTMLGEGGITVSGGQRQRIAIARMLLRNSPILLLDEATSALDNISQSAIQKTLDSLNGNHTLIIIAHRLSTIVNCDRILFMENGHIIASGTHQQMLENCPQYAELYEGEDKI